MSGLGGKKGVFISACVVPMICPPPGHLQVEFVKEMYPYLRSLELADEGHPSDGENSDGIEILIGSDYYWAFVYNDIIRDKSGPVAAKSLFG